MNTNVCKLTTGVLAISALLVLGVPQNARAEYLTNTACTLAPPVQPLLLSPGDGATGVPLTGNWVEIAVPTAGGPALDGQRVVLADGTPYANNGGTLQLDTSGYLAPPNVNLASMAIAKAWLPPLRPDTHYTVRLQLPNQGNCVYATLGSFTTGPPE